MALTSSDSFPHGEHRGYMRGCRCDPCSAANRTRNRAYRDGFGVRLSADVPRAHLRWLMARGASVNSLAEASGVARPNISSMLYDLEGRPSSSTISVEHGDAIMALRLRNCAASVPAEWGEALERLLVDAGWTKKGIGQAIGLSREIRHRRRWPTAHYYGVRKLADDLPGATEVLAAHDEALDAPPSSEAAWRELRDELELHRAKRALFRRLKGGSYETFPGRDQRLWTQVEEMAMAGDLLVADPEPIERPAPITDRAELWRARRAEYEDLLAELTTIMRWRGENRSWLRKRACKGVDPDTFFPGRGTNATEAHALCGACPVRAQCLEHAGPFVGTNGGVVGGQSAKARRASRARATA